MNNVYIYDGSFKELVNLIWLLLKENIRPKDIKTDTYEGCLFDNLVHLELGNRDYIPKLLKWLGKNNFKLVYCVYLSKDQRKELIIYYYLLNYQK